MACFFDIKENDIAYFAVFNTLSIFVLILAFLKNNFLINTPITAFV